MEAAKRNPMLEKTTAGKLFAMRMRKHKMQHRFDETPFLSEKKHNARAIARGEKSHVGSYRRFFEAGRLAKITFGKHEGKLCIIVDLMNRTRAIVEGPQVERQQIPLRRLALTDHRLNINRNTSGYKLRKAMMINNVIAEFKRTSEGRRYFALKEFETMSDFEKHKLKKARGHLHKLAKFVMTKRKDEVKAKKRAESASKMEV